MIKKCPICGGDIPQNIFDRCFITVIERVKKAERDMRELKTPNSGCAYDNGVNDSVLILRDILKKEKKAR